MPLVALLTSQSLARGATPRETVDRLTSTLNRSDGLPISLYLLDARGEVLAGSNRQLEDERFERLAIQPTVPSAEALRGELILGNGERLIYAAHLLRTSAVEEGQDAPAVVLLTQPRRPMRFTLSDLLRRLVWVGLVALSFSALVAALFAYSIARPLDRIAQAAEEIAAGHYDQELHISAPAEVARLATSFNTMARQVKATLQSQQDLVANVSHDLKTPLTSIQGFSQALLDGTAGDEAARERAATIIHEESGRMRRLVDELLDLARLEAGQVTLAHEAVDVGLLLRECAACFAPRSEKLDVVLDVELLEPLPQVEGDPDRLSQVFGNLLDNALKHVGGGSEQGRVVLRAEHSEGTVICSVTDNGSGIPAQDLPRVFERFYQVDKARVRRESGAGLGLAIAREIVHAHGGSIRVESVEGLGTRFVVDLPALGPEQGSG
jgi:two-component system OmpR family sensor kinase